MSERKDKIIELGDVFIALPGGPGTLEEITEVISWSRIGQNNAPCILYNKNGYSNPLKTMYQSMVSNGFLTKKDFDKILRKYTILSKIMKFQKSEIKTKLL